MGFPSRLESSACRAYSAVRWITPCPGVGPCVLPPLVARQQASVGGGPIFRPVGSRAYFILVRRRASSLVQGSSRDRSRHSLLLTSHHR